MPKRIIHAVTRFCWLLIIGGICPLLHANDKVVLQLKWEHEFQFAGYYAAQWQGYYDQEGLDVEIRGAATADGTMLSPLEELTLGRADFAIGGSDIFLHQGEGHNLKVLAPIFQRSPAAFFSLESQPLLNVDQAAKLRIASVPSDDTHIEARAMFFMNGIDPDRVNFVEEPVTIESLLDGKADAIVTYSVSAQARAKELGVALNTLTTADNGIQFYGDILYTRAELARKNPELAERFLRATLKGWRYAGENRQQIADRISSELPRYIYQYDDVKAYNTAFAQVIDDYTFYPIVELGHLDQNRWRRTYDILERLGEIREPYEPMELLFDRPGRQVVDNSIYLWGFSALLILSLCMQAWKNDSGRWQIIAVLGLILFLEQALETWHRQDQNAQKTLNTLEHLSTLRSNLEQVLARNLAELRGVASFIAANPDLSQREFDEYARSILQLDPQLINLAAAPDLIVRYVYPQKGNEAVIGLDYRENADQFPAVQHAMTYSNPIITGPVNLVQGGKAFIARAPVRTIDETGQPQNWGIVSAPIDVAAVYREAGLLDPELGLSVAIRGKSGVSPSGEVFYGHPATFSQAEAITQTVSFPGGTWQIAAMTTRESTALEPRLLLIRLFFVVVTLLSLMLLNSRRRNRLSQQHYQQMLKRQAEFLREVETVAHIGGWRMDDSGAICELSQHARKLLGVDAESIPLDIAHFADCFSQGDKQNLATLLQETLIGDQGFELDLQSKDGEMWFHLIGDPTIDFQGRREIIGAIQDITEKKKSDEKIERQANYDTLTNLPNRALFWDRLETAIAMANRKGTSLVLLFIDLDKFKPINDNYGHREGDLVLQEMARRIQSCVRRSDTVGRQSGDEFTVILNEVKGESAVDKIVSGLVAELSRPLNVAGKEVYSGASIGIAFYPGDADTADGLLVNADQAMYEVKKAGGNGWYFYTEEMQRRSEHRHNLYNDLLAGIRNGELRAYLQPIVSITTGRTIGCEALARWQRPDGSWIYPSEFVPLAEETGLVNRIDYLITEQAKSSLVRINERLQQNLKLSINVSPRLFQTKDQALQQWLELIRATSQIVPLSVEITERLLTEMTDSTTNTLNELSNLNVDIVIDDFGTGYSSLGYLTRFPVSGLKIDKSFIHRIGKDAATEQVIETILAMAAKLKLDVIAEGVETPEQLAYLTALGCESAQGYLLGSPMPPEDFMARIEKEALSFD